MIKSFKHKGLKIFFEKGTTKGINSQHTAKLSRQLAKLNVSKDVQDMNIPGWNLHPLAGNKQDYWSVHVNGNWVLFLGLKIEMRI